MLADGFFDADTMRLRMDGPTFRIVSGDDSPKYFSVNRLASELISVLAVSAAKAMASIQSER